MDNFFQWREEWLLGLEGIDDQHRGLVEAVNRLFPLYQKLARSPKTDNATRERLAARLNLLYGDLEQHFGDEEELMRKIGYPDYRSYALAHLMLLAELRNYTDRFADRDEELDLGTLNSLKTWFITHILDDRGLADHVHAFRATDGTYGDADGGC